VDAKKAVILHKLGADFKRILKKSFKIKYLLRIACAPASRRAFVRRRFRAIMR
jgi:hypothetical protein